MVRLNFLEKKFFCVKELFKVIPADIPHYSYYVRCNAKRMLRLTFIEKKLCNSLENIELFAFFNFENIDFLLSQGIVQSEPN